MPSTRTPRPVASALGDAAARAVRTLPQSPVAAGFGAVQHLVGAAQSATRIRRSSGDPGAAPATRKKKPTRQAPLARSLTEPRLLVRLPHPGR